MTQYALIILAMMLQLIPPGQSVYSQVPIAWCDEQCQQTPLCDNKHNWRCSKPKLDHELYQNNLEFYHSTTLNEDEAQRFAKNRSFTRPETYDEGLVRYGIIAQAIADVSKEGSFHACKNECSKIAEHSRNTCDNDKVCIDDTNTKEKQCYIQCKKTSPWIWNQRHLAYMLATVTNQESGYRLDVHGGTGPAGRGDCKWEFPDGRPARAWTKGAQRISGTCRSVCIAQINIGGGKTQEGWVADDLVGVDYESTKRCLTVAVRNLSRSRMMCTKWNKIDGDWAKATFAAYGTGSACKANQKKYIKVDGKAIAHYAYRVKNGVEWARVPPSNAISNDPIEAAWPVKRAKIFHKYRKLGLNVSDNVKEKLEHPEIKLVYETLYESEFPIYWMMKVPSKIHFTAEVHSSIQ